MRTRALLLVPIAVALAACSSGGEQVASEPTASEVATTEASPTTPEPSPTPTPSEAPTPTPTAAVASDVPPEECIAQAARPASIPDAAGGEGISAAARTAVLPSYVAMFAPQVIASTDKPGTFEAIVRVCATPLTQPDLVEIATSVGAAIYADPSRESLSVLIVTAWTPDGSGSVKQDLSVRADSYGDYLWDNTTGALDAAWE